MVFNNLPHLHDASLPWPWCPGITPKQTPFLSSSWYVIFNQPQSFKIRAFKSWAQFNKTQVGISNTLVFLFKMFSTCNCSSREKGLRNSVFSVCLFAHLRCVHIVFEQYFWRSFLFVSFSHTLLVSILSPKYQSQLTTSFFFLNARMTSLRQSKKAMHAVKNKTLNDKTPLNVTITLWFKKIPCMFNNWSLNKFTKLN